MKLRGSLLMPVLAGMALTSLATGCKSNNNDENKPGPVNPPAPTPQPLVLRGLVVDSVSAAPIADAKVTILKADGSTLASLTTDAKGAYSQDVSAVTGDALTVRATANGYVLGTVTAALNKTNNLASVPTLKLYKFQGATQTIGATGGSVNTAPTTEAVSNTPVALSLPAGAVTTATALTVGPLPIAQVPAPPADTVQTLAVVSIAPEGVTFAQPAEVACPLPLKSKAGKQLNAFRLNASNQWEAIAAKAVVDAAGTAVKLAISATGTYTFTENIKVNANASAAMFETASFAPAAPETRTVTLAEGSQTLTLDERTDMSLASQSGDVPTIAWLTGLATQRTGAFERSQAIFQLGVPALPSNYVRDGRQINPDKPQESGRWAYRWTFETYNPGTRYMELTGDGSFSAKLKLEPTRWRVTGQTGWVWITTTGATGVTGGTN